MDADFTEKSGEVALLIGTTDEEHFSRNSKMWFWENLELSESVCKLVN